MKPNNEFLNFPIEVAIDKISKATGNDSFRLIDPLSGYTSGSKFRLTSSPGFNYPCQPILTGKIEKSINGSSITYSFVPPYLGIISLILVWGILISITWPDIQSTTIGSVIIIVISIFCFSLRKYDKKKLLSELLERLKNESV